MEKKFIKFKSWLLLLALLLLSSNAYSEKYLYKLINNVYYTLDSETKEAEVKSYTNSKKLYVGNVTISQEVTYLDEQYTVTAIGDFAFEDCTQLTSIALPETIKTIGFSAFRNCTGLTSFEIPKNVTSIDNYAFWGCEKLTTIHSYMKQPCTLGSSVFNKVPSTAMLYVPFGSKSLYQNATGWKSLQIVERLEVGDTYEGTTKEGVKLVYKVTGVDEKTCQIVSLADGSSPDGSLTLPSEANGMAVTAIGRNAFKGCDGLQSVTIPATVTTIEYAAFQGCSYLTAVHIRSITPPATGVIPQGGWNAFDKISSDAILYVPVGTKSAYQNASWSQFKEIKEERENNELFTAFTEEGVSMQFVVLSTANMTCAVGSGDVPAIDAETVGSVTIPSEVEEYSVVKINNNAFEGCVKMTSISLPNTITTAVNGSFTGCTALETAVINCPEVSQWFRGSSIKKVVFGPDVVNIYYGAFMNCTNLASIEITDNTRNVSNTAFQNTAWYEDQPDGLVYLGVNAYLYKGEMPNNTSINIKDGTIIIGESLFSGCKGLVDVSIPSTVTSIRSHAFVYCENLKNLYIPASVIEMTGGDSSPFWGCNGLESIAVETGNPKYDSRDNCNAIIETSTNTLLFGCKNTVIPGTVTSIGDVAFYGCSGLKTLFIPKSLNNFSFFSFTGCYGIENIIVEDGHPKYDSRDNCNAIIETVANEQAGTTTSTLIYGCKNTTIPNTVTSIGSNAFSNCIGLTEITIPNSVKSISNNAFSGCSGLTSIIIPGSVTLIGTGAFVSTNISNVEFQHTKEELEALTWSTQKTNDFKGAMETKLKFSADVAGKVYINYFLNQRRDGFYYWARANKDCFYNIDGASLFLKLTTDGSDTWIPINGVLEEGAVRIYTSAIDKNATGQLDISQVNTKSDGSGNMYSIKSIDAYAFYQCPNLTSVIIGNSVTNIGREAFAECTNLTSATIGNGLVSLSRELFRGCSKLASVTIPEGIATLEIGVFCDCTGLTSVTLPNSLTTISTDVFYNCPNLTFLVIPDGVKRLENGIFSKCDNITVIFPKQLEYIGKKTLKGIRCAVFTNENVPVFESGSSDYTVSQISVPVGSLDAYTSLFGGQDKLIVTSYVGYEATPAEVSINNSPVTACHATITSHVLKDGEYVSTTENYSAYGLTPESVLEQTWTLTDGNRVIYRGTATSMLTFETLPAQATSNTKALISAKTNGEDDGLRFGFEWRRYDAPDLVPSTVVNCPVYDGVMAGTLNGLSANTYYKYRPFYKSDAGNTYYGEWIAFGTADAYVYFEPVIHTYDVSGITEDEATLKGSVVAGSDDILEQGFEYWIETNSSTTRTQQNIQIIKAEGAIMSAVLSHLQSGTTYGYRAYVKTAKGTTYGENRTFTTKGEPTGIVDIIIKDGEQAKAFNVYSLTGRIVRGNVTSLDNLPSGLYIVKGKKVFVK